MEPLADSFALAADAQAFVRRLQLLPEHAHTADALILCIDSQRAVMLRGWPCNALIAEPKIQGPFREMWRWFLAGLGKPVLNGEDPEFIVLIDAAVWSSLDATARERLIYHELKHLQVKENAETGEPRLHKDGRLQLRLVPHDVEVFTDEVARYGPEVTGLETLCEAIVTGATRQKDRRGRVA